MKKCNNCRREFPDSDFIGDSGKEVKRCKICREVAKRSYKLHAAKIKEYRIKNADKIKENKAEYYKKNRDRISERIKAYYRKNADKLIAYQKEYYNKNEGKKVEYQKEYYRKNTEKLKNYLKEYQKENASRLREQSKEYRKDNYEIIKERKREYLAKKALYATYVDRLTVDEHAESNENGELVVKCFKCASKFVPTNAQAQSRVVALSKDSRGECHLYCSQECKDSCYVYKVNYDPAEKEYSTPTLRDPEWSRLVKERDNFTCQKCGSTEGVQAHHVEPVALRPELSDDLDNGLTLCKRCHREVHNQDGCDLVYLRNNKVKIC